MSELAFVDVEQRYGVTARELLDLQPPSPGKLTASALETWLVEHGLAEPNGEPGRLVPTMRGIEVGGTLA